MLKKTFIWGLIASVLSMGILTNASGAVKAGAACSKVGSKSVSGGKSYTCVKSGKKLVWDKGVLVPVAKPAPSASASAAPANPIPAVTKQPDSPKIYPAGSGYANPPVYPENDGSRAIQKLIDSLDFSKSTNKTSVNLILEQGKNGPYVEIGVAGVEYALRFYSALGMNIPHLTLNLILARTHPWALEQIKSTVPNCSIEDGPLLDGGATLCPNSKVATIFTNLVQGTAHNPNIDPNVDLSGVIETSDWFADFAHETMHVYQYSQDSNFNDMPRWMFEGAAQFFGYLAAARYSNGAITYNHEVEKYLDYSHDVQGMCSTSISKIQSPCEYTLGLFATEYLVQKYGVKGYQDLLMNSGSGNFDSRVQKIFGISQAQLYADIDKYAKERGWGPK